MDSTQGGQLHSGDSIDQVLSHEVKELGTHILVCEVSYSAPGKSKMNFRKFFKFNVMKPLDVKTKFYNAEVSITKNILISYFVSLLEVKVIFFSCTILFLSFTDTKQLCA